MGLRDQEGRGGGELLRGFGEIVRGPQVTEATAEEDQQQADQPTSATSVPAVERFGLSRFDQDIAFGSVIIGPGGELWHHDPVT
jgi:hypothetical protein